MKTTYRFLAVCLVTLSILLTGCSTPPVNSSAPRQINVVGRGEVYLTPDVAYINIGVKSKADNVSAALSQNNEQAQAISSILKEQGVAEKDIQTMAFNVYPQPEYGPQGELVKTSYAVENTVFVKVHDLQNLGKLLDAVVRAGANTINNIQFDVLDKSSAEKEARQKAIEDARTQAQEMAKAAQVDLGNLLTLNAYNVGGSPAPVYRAMDGKNMAAAEAPIAAGQLVLTYEANMSYEIK